jgi:hypothetical protein
MSPKRGTRDSVSVSDSVVRPPITAVCPESINIVVTRVDERVRGSAIEPSRPAAPRV